MIWYSDSGGCDVKNELLDDLEDDSSGASAEHVLRGLIRFLIESHGKPLHTLLGIFYDELKLTQERSK